MCGECIFQSTAGELRFRIVHSRRPERPAHASIICRARRTREPITFIKQPSPQSAAAAAAGSSSL